MIRFNFRNIICGGLIAGMSMACENQDVKFPDSGLSTVYFAYQYPVRTIVQGDDIYDNSLDNEGKFEIYATMGGVYQNNKKITIDIAVDDAIGNNLYLDEELTVPLLPMPSSYYTLASNQIVLDKSMQGAVQVQLTDDFFNDVNALRNTYAIPLKMTNVTNADSILSGKAKPGIPSPNRVVALDWDNLPKDYVLYIVKYINPWHANYLRRGTDRITTNGDATTVVRHQPSVETDEVIAVKASSRNTVVLPQVYKTYNGLNIPVNLEITVDEDGSISVAQNVAELKLNDSTTVNNIVATGTGSFVKKGEKNSWGGKDRDVMYLEYDVTYEVESTFPNLGDPTRLDEVSYHTNDTLVTRDRGIKVETVTPFYKN
jgi:hypothetical protein